MELVSDDRRAKGIGPGVSHKKSPRLSHKKKAQDLVSINQNCSGEEPQFLPSKRASGKIMPLRSLPKDVLGAKMRSGGTVKFDDESQLSETQDGRADCNISSVSTTNQIRTMRSGGRRRGGGGSQNTSFGEGSELGSIRTHGQGKDRRRKGSPTIGTDFSNISEQPSKENEGSMCLENLPDSLLDKTNLDNTNLDGTNLDNTRLHNDSSVSMLGIFGQIKPRTTILSPTPNRGKPGPVSVSQHGNPTLPDLNRSEAPTPSKAGLFKGIWNGLIDSPDAEIDAYNIDIMIPFLSLRSKTNSCLRFFIKIALSETFNVLRISFT